MLVCDRSMAKLFSKIGSGVGSTSGNVLVEVYDMDP
jgi:hypothetical protein